ncbi:LysR family transcriptional regulator [Bradyrhizobium sp. WSM 1738]|uniref:LysR substrate-binding domain-containing protein n=1 Tax=Bradyrhizobium hereditatis TaxID=2821405 RepID=UPI001CE37E18|nr:LysR substrate-binding domain-containing protein [Bradyrhizobium hereditatis]MCA6115749.1 LysR family transcriptional regulator [Bradyrhizobium hereditatis]
MRFDLVDLQLFIAVAETRSITNGAQRVHLALASASERIKGLEEALGVLLLARGRRGVELTPAGETLLDHARIVIHNVEAMRGDLLSFARGVKATVRFLANTSALSEYLPKTLASFLKEHPHISIDVEEHESGDIARAIVTGAADLGLAAEHALPDNIERLPFSEDRLVLVAPREGELSNRRQVEFAEVVGRDFIGLITSSALHAHVSGHAARLGARLRFRARLNNFDSIGQMVAAGIGIAVMPEVAAKRCAQSMKINVIRIKDSWANRRLAICARSFRSLPKPAQQFAEHLRKSAPR